jgi:diaminohydroxyphosphoribosylaminopyrimidine deaminase/5-amino-6-(5-phosphoribosylamino)uracil reductase
MTTAADHEYMGRALQLAEKGLYGTSPNPRVGCIMVRDGKVVGEGWHERAGEPHAEVHALRAAGEKAAGATVYVTLEPCSHHGRTPPCADALIAAGVGRVVAAMEDPNPKVAGEGLKRLQAAGVATETGVLASQARELNIGFVSRMTRKRPWLRIKTASSLDGKTALSNGQSKWITGEHARRDVQHWRARSCAILTGIGTVLADDPRLNVREIETSRQPLRVVVDSQLKMPLQSEMLKHGKTLIATTVRDDSRMAQLQEAGAEVIVLPQKEGRVDLHKLMEELGRREINEVMTEAGRTLNGALLLAGLVDEMIMYLAPALLGDAARGLFDLGELKDMSQRLNVSLQDVRMVGGDLRLRLR